MWVSLITAVGLEMVLPGLAGQWLDGQLGTSFFALAGFALGIAGGLWHLLVMTKASQSRTSDRDQDEEEVKPIVTEQPHDSESANKRQGLALPLHVAHCCALDPSAGCRLVWISQQWGPGSLGRRYRGVGLWGGRDHRISSSGAYPSDPRRRTGNFARHAVSNGSSIGARHLDSTIGWRVGASGRVWDDPGLLSLGTCCGNAFVGSADWPRWQRRGEGVTEWLRLYCT